MQQLQQVSNCYQRCGIFSIVFQTAKNFLLNEFDIGLNPQKEEGKIYSIFLDNTTKTDRTKNTLSGSVYTLVNHYKIQTSVSLKYLISFSNFCSFSIEFGFLVIVEKMKKEHRYIPSKLMQSALANRWKAKCVTIRNDVENANDFTITLQCVRNKHLCSVDQMNDQKTNEFQLKLDSFGL